MKQIHCLHILSSFRPQQYQNYRNPLNNATKISGEHENRPVYGKIDFVEILLALDCSNTTLFKAYGFL